MTLETRLRSLSPARLIGIGRGIEKEGLRALPDGSLALTPHPEGLGSALSHPNITTDFSESQLELITGVHTDTEACIEELTQIHQAVHGVLGDELLWASSMPCVLPAEAAIPLGFYGSSNIGRAKAVYRMGLSHRYGRRMQTISGLHYNFSLPGVSSEEYFSLIRNFRRHSWLVLYLFGASPALDKRFLDGKEHGLLPMTSDTLFAPHATSLRMGRLGYQSDAQSRLAVSFNNLETYGATLHEALTRPYAPYEAIGLRTASGEYSQLATSLLQNENEFYGTIRPKRVIRMGERPLHALRERGVEYVEVRCMDLDPFEPVGINAQTTRFIDVFLLHCLLADSPPDSPDEVAAIARNQQRTAARGREPDLLLERNGEVITQLEWASQLLAACAPIAEALDAAHAGSKFHDALAAASYALAHPQSLPSARVLETMKRDHDDSFRRFGVAQSVEAKRKLSELPLAAAEQERFARLAVESIAATKEIEAAEQEPFETFRQHYLSPEMLGGARPHGGDGS